MTDKELQKRVWALLIQHNVDLKDIRAYSLFLHVDNIRCVFNERKIKCPEWVRAHKDFARFIEPDGW